MRKGAFSPSSFLSSLLSFPPFFPSPSLSDPPPLPRPLLHRLCTDIFPSHSHLLLQASPRSGRSIFERQVGRGGGEDEELPQLEELGS
jgi:hypothetical protein